MKKSLLATLTLSAWLAAAPVQAALQNSADFKDGHTIGAGLFGLSYDYGFSPGSLGAVISTGNDFNFFSSAYRPRLKIGLRGILRFWEQESLSAGIIAGAQYDPGSPGEKAYLTPDAGLSLAYHIKDWGLALRINVTLAANARNYGYFSPSDSQASPNFFQMLTLGPNTSLEVAYQPMENLEITLGGGTFLGMRMNF